MNQLVAYIILIVILFSSCKNKSDERKQLDDRESTPTKEIQKGDNNLYPQQFRLGIWRIILIEINQPTQIKDIQGTSLVTKPGTVVFLIKFEISNTSKKDSVLEIDINKLMSIDINNTSYPVTAQRVFSEAYLPNYNFKLLDSGVYGDKETGIHAKGLEFRETKIIEEKNLKGWITKTNKAIEEAGVILESPSRVEWLFKREERE